MLILTLLTITIPHIIITISSNSRGLWSLCTLAVCVSPRSLRARRAVCA